MSYKYEYTGDAEVAIRGAGLVKKGDVIKMAYEVNHPDFKPMGKTEKKKPKADK